MGMTFLQLWLQEARALGFGPNEFFNGTKKFRNSIYSLIQAFNSKTAVKWPLS